MLTGLAMRMHIKTRRKVGWLVVGVSILTAVAIQLLTGAVVQARTVREDKLQSGPDFAVVTSEIALTINPHYAVPLATCCLLGLACLAWPSRKPPLLPT